MKSNRILVTVILAATVIAGCYKQSYTVGTGGDITRAPNYSEWQPHYFFGLIGESNIDVKSICPSGNATVKDQHTFVNLLIGALIGIIYHPTTVEVWCGEEGTTSSVVIPAETLRKIALDPRAYQLAQGEQAAQLAAAVQAYSTGATRLSSAQ